MANFKKIIDEKWSQNNLSSSRKIAIGGLFLALGLIFPALFHLASMTGPIFLPMHIPVLIAGMILGPMYGGFIGLLTPILSSLFTGMPAVFPMLPIMAVEVCLYGFMSGMIYKKSKNIFFSQYAAMIVGRLGYGAVFFFMVNILGKNIPPQISVAGATITGLPGIILQILIVPVLFIAIKQALLSLNINFNSILHKNGFTLAVIKNKKLVSSSFEKGIKPLYNLYKKSPKILAQSIVCDRVTGKAAAALMVLADVAEIRCDVVSRHGLEVLQKSHMKVKYSHCVPYIINRNKDGMCPMEELVLKCESTKEAVETIDKFMQKAADKI